MFSLHCIVLYICFYYYLCSIQVYSKDIHNNKLENKLLDKDQIYNRVYNNIKNIKQNQYVSSKKLHSNSKNNILKNDMDIENNSEYIDFISSSMNAMDSLLHLIKKGDFDSWLEHEYYTKFLNEFVSYNQNLNILTNEQLSMLNQLILMEDVNTKRAILIMGISHINKKSSLQSLFKYAYGSYMKYYKLSKQITKKQSESFTIADWDVEQLFIRGLQEIPKDVHELLFHILYSNSVNGKTSTRKHSQFVTFVDVMNVFRPYFEGMNSKLQDLLVELSMDEEHRSQQVINKMFNELILDYEEPVRHWLNSIVHDKLRAESDLESESEQTLGMYTQWLEVEMKQNSYLQNLETVRSLLVEYLPQIDRFLEEYYPNYHQIVQKRQEFVATTAEMELELGDRSKSTNDYILSRCSSIEDCLVHYQDIVLSLDLFRMVFSNYNLLLSWLKSN